MMQTGYSNTFVPFRNGVIEQFNKGQYAEALDSLKKVNRFQWLNMIDTFGAAEVMWMDAAYEADEIVEWWIAESGLTLNVCSAR